MIKYIKIDKGNHVKSNYNNDIVMSIDATCYVNNDFNTTQNSNNDFSFLYNCDKNFDINDNCDAKPKET